MSKVWFFLVEVEALPGGDMYAPGSRAFVQCCVPGHSLEETIAILDDFLLRECYSRIDLSIAHRYDTADPEEEYPEVAEESIRRAATIQQPTFGVFVHAKDSAKLQTEVEDNVLKNRKRHFQ